MQSPKTCAQLKPPIPSWGSPFIPLSVQLAFCSINPFPSLRVFSSGSLTVALRGNLRVSQSSLLYGFLQEKQSAKGERIGKNEMKKNGT